MVFLWVGFAFLACLLGMAFVAQYGPSLSMHVSPLLLVVGGLLAAFALMIFQLIRAQKDEDAEARPAPALEQAKGELQQLLAEANRLLVEEYRQKRPAQIAMPASLSSEERARRELLSVAVAINRQLFTEIGCHR